MNDRLMQLTSHLLITAAIVFIVLSLTVGRGEGNDGYWFALFVVFLESPRCIAECQSSVAASYSPSLVQRWPLSPVAAVSLEDRRITPSASWS
jgi:hypothetical protein